jgi:hypothetical protein
MPPPQALDSAGQGRHKGRANTPAKALRTEGPGFDANQTSRAFVYLTVGLASIADQLIVGLLVAAPLLADPAITRTEVCAQTVRTSYSIVY